VSDSSVFGYCIKFTLLLDLVQITLKDEFFNITCYHCARPSAPKTAKNAILAVN